METKSELQSWTIKQRVDGCWLIKDRDEENVAVFSKWINEAMARKVIEVLNNEGGDK